MSYDQVVGTTEPPLTVKEQMYRSYLRPLLKHEPESENLGFFFEKAWLAWRIGIKKDDLKKMLFVEWMCGELAKSHQKDLVEIVSMLLQEAPESATRMNLAERHAYNSNESGKVERIASDTLALYHAFFENEFRLWAAVPYFFACKHYGIEKGASEAEAYVRIGASPKYHALAGIRAALPQGSLSDLVSGFDSEIRNAGKGHESWSISDRGTIELYIINPKTGKLSGKAKLDLTIQDLESLIQQCRRTVWVLEMGLFIFLVNNPEFADRIHRTRGYKIKEIQARVEQVADERWLRLVDFRIDEKRSLVELHLRYAPKHVGERASILSSGGVAFDLVNVRREHKYRDQILGILQHMLAMFGEGGLPEVWLKVSDAEGKSLGEPKFHPDELKKLFLEKAEENIPLPYEGAMPGGTYQMILQVRVPYGSREFFERRLSERS